MPFERDYTPQKKLDYERIGKMVAKSMLNNLPKELADLKPEVFILHDRASTIRFDFLLHDQVRVGTRRHIVGFALQIHPINKRIDSEYSPTWESIGSIKKNESN